jgi:hypothetical protein
MRRYGMLGNEYSGSGLVGGNVIGGYGMQGSGLVGGKLPTELRIHLIERNPVYERAVARGEYQYRENVASGKLPIKGTPEAKAAVAKAQATKAANKQFAIGLTAKVIDDHPYISAHQADQVYKSVKKAVSKDARYEKQFIYRARKAEKLGKPPPVPKKSASSVDELMAGLRITKPVPRKYKVPVAMPA